MHPFFFKCFLFFSSVITLNVAIAQPLAQTLNVSIAIEAQAEATSQGGQSFLLARHQGDLKHKLGLSEDSSLSNITTLNLDPNSSIRTSSIALSEAIKHFINRHQILSDVVAYQYRRAFFHIFTRSRDLINLS